MARKQKFLKSPGPKAPGWGTPIGLIHWSDSEVDGDKKNPNAYAMRRSRYTYSYGTLRSYYRNSPKIEFYSNESPLGGDFTSHSVVSEWTHGRPLFSPRQADAYNAALSVLLNRLKAKDWNTVVFGAELGKSFAMITNSATKLYATIKALKRGRLGDAYSALGIQPPRRAGRAGRRRYPKPKSVRENAQSYWLELQMGWKPVLSDLDNAAKAIADYVVKTPPNLCKVTGRGGVEWVQRTPIAGGTQFYPGSTHDKHSGECQLVLYYTFSDRTIASAKKFGLTTVLPTIWELVPLSWVVDYVIGIGDFLENLTAYQGLEFKSGCVTHLYRLERRSGQSGKGMYTETKSYYGETSYVSAFSTASGWTYTESHFSMNRSVMTSFPYPRWPKVNLDFHGERGVVKTLNLLALFGQFKSKTS